MCFAVYEVLSSPVGLAALLGCLLALCGALAYLYSMRKPGDREEESDSEEEDEPEPRKLRTRPLKPAIDLSIYKYRTDLH